MPKLIDYPRTSYPSAWEVAEVVDDTGGKCALETCARKLNRKVSGSFKAIVGSAVKFGLLTSKREMLTTTTLFRRIKHAYDKQEELLFHREAFLTPPLFTQLCRKFRSRELPVAMLDVLLIREFDVEEINAQNVAKAFVEGARMVGLLDEQNILTDIDQLAAKQPPRRELASPPPAGNSFRQNTPQQAGVASPETEATSSDKKQATEAREGKIVAATLVTGGRSSAGLPLPATRPAPAATNDAVANLFNLTSTTERIGTSPTVTSPGRSNEVASPEPTLTPPPLAPPVSSSPAPPLLFQLQITGPGVNTALEVTDADDLILVRALLDKLERLLKRN